MPQRLKSDPRESSEQKYFFSVLPSEERSFFMPSAAETLRTPPLKEKYNFQPRRDFNKNCCLIPEVRTNRLEPLRSGEVPWYYLSGTGFFVKNQTDVLIAGLKQRMRTGERFNTALDSELVKVKVDIEAFEDEYLKQLAGLRWNIGWKDVDDKQRIVAKAYNHALLESVTGKSEREGAVHDLWFTGNPSQNVPGVEKWLQTAPENSLAVIVSPDGWSGLSTPDEKPIRYTETQVYAVKTKKNGELEAYTFRYEANILQNEQLQRKFGLTVSNAANQKEQIKQMLKNVAFFRGDNPNNKIKNMKDVVDIMEEIKGNNITIKGKTFDDIRAFLRNPQDFLHRHDKTPELIHQFKEFVKWEFSQGHMEQETTTNLQIALALTILKLNRLYRDQERPDDIIYSTDYHTRKDVAIYAYSKNLDMNYKSEVENLQKRGGCAGGGSKKEVSLFSSMGSSRIGETISLSTSESYSFDHEGTCVACRNGPKKLGPCDICESCDVSLR